METNLKKVNNASVAKRLLAIIMDAAVFVFTYIALVIFAFVPLADKIYDVSNNRALEYETRVFSKLFVLEEKLPNSEEIRIINNSDELKQVVGETQIVGLTKFPDDKIDKKERLKYYYCNYKTNTDLVFEKGSQAENNNIVVDGNEISPIDYYTNYIEPVTNSDKLNELVLDAEFDLNNSDFMQKLGKQLEKSQWFYLGIPLAFCYGIYIILIPLLFKNGETLGKKVTHICFVTKDGYSIKKRQTVFRSLLLVAYITVPILMGGDVFTSVGFLGLFAFVYVLFIYFYKDHRSFIDIAAYTWLIDANTSVWFATVQEEESHNKKVDKNLKNYKKIKVENKNLIQVGTEILDEELKAKIENKKKTKK